MSQSKYLYFQDPGHGWVKVSKQELTRLGILDKISFYSYSRKDYVYLEEDLDLGTFFGAKAVRNERVELVHRHTNKPSKIRSYDSHRA
jgi:hypothetical protein